MSWVRTQKRVERGDPSLAALLTWMIPGAGHLYLKQPVLALSGFVVVAGLYLLGLELSHGMAFEFLQPDLRGPFAGALTPEAANLGALVWHMRHFGYGLSEPRPWPEHIHLGAWLTAVSGMLNACLMVRAHVDARTQPGVRRGVRHPASVVLLGWLLPGLGHFVQGRRLRGGIVFALLVGLLALGTVLAEGSNLDRERHFYYWGGQFLAGAPAMVLEAIAGGRPVRGELPYVDAGLVFASLAGLLNVLALLDAYGWADGHGEGTRGQGARVASEGVEVGSGAS
jgi:hypothetical protein